MYELFEWVDNLDWFSSLLLGGMLMLICGAFAWGLVWLGGRNDT